MIPENLTGALHRATFMQWSSDVRTAFIITDAPCHGANYWSGEDEFPNGDPLGRDPEQLIRDLAIRLSV